MDPNATDALLAANEAFYRAFARADNDAMAAIWAEGDAVSCIHPGWPAIVGREAVIQSWREILKSPRRPDIVFREPHALVQGESGHVICIEIIGPLALAASNHFRLIGGLWRMVHHQSSQIARAHPTERAEAPAPRQVH